MWEGVLCRFLVCYFCSSDILCAGRSIFVLVLHCFCPDFVYMHCNWTMWNKYFANVCCVFVVFPQCCCVKRAAGHAVAYVFISLTFCCCLFFLLFNSNSCFNFLLFLLFSSDSLCQANMDGSTKQLFFRNTRFLTVHFFCLVAVATISMFLAF